MMDSTGRTIKQGDKVRFRGQAYTIKEFGPPIGCMETHIIVFEESAIHTNEVPDEISVDFIKSEVAWVDPDHDEGDTATDPYTKDLEDMLRRIVEAYNQWFGGEDHELIAQAKALLERTGYTDDF